MPDPIIETRTPEQLPRATAISPDALITVQEEGAPVVSIAVKALLGRLVQTDTAKESRADLLADLDHDDSSVALVFADPDPAKNGWYRKTGVSGGGTWTQFEKLSAFAAAEIAEYVDQASTSATTATNAADAAQALVNFRLTLAEGVADFAPGEFFSSAETGELRCYQRTWVPPFYTDLGDLVAPLTRALLGSSAGDQMVGAFDGRELRDHLVAAGAGPLRIAASGDDTGVTDTRALRAAVAAGRSIQLGLPADGEYYLLGDVTTDWPDEHFRFGITGDRAAPANEKPRIVVKKPGVTPFPGATQSALLGVAIAYEQTGVTPAVSGDVWSYARAIEATGTISTDSGKLRLTVPGGGLIGGDAEFPNVTRGSMVVMLADPGKYQDYWVNNYADEDSILQIDEVLSDTVCTLQGKAGTAYTGPVHIRGNGMATVWTVNQPTDIRCEDNALGPIPGAGLMTMGAQKLVFDKNYLGPTNGEPHVNMIYAGNRSLGWGAASVYHQCSAVGNMAFFACGGYAINGWIDSTIARNQLDNNAQVNDALATYFPHPRAQHSFAALYNTNPTNLSAEEGNSPNGIYMYQCQWSRLIDPHVAEQAFATWPITIQACTNFEMVGERISPEGIGDPAKTIRFIGHGSAANLEVERRPGGRHGAGVNAYKGGAFGAFASYLDTRDRTVHKFTLPASVLEAHAGSTYLGFLSSDDLVGGWEGYDLALLEGLVFEHGGPWNGSFGPGTPPTVAIGNSVDGNFILPPVPLDEDAGFYLDAANIGRDFPIAFAPGALGTTSLFVTFQSGGGGAMNNGTFAANDITFYVIVSRVRS